MSDDKLMGKYIKYLSKRYIIEEEYLKDLFIQLKTFIIYWFDKKMNANIQYIEYKGNGIVIKNLQKMKKVLFPLN